MDFFTRMFTSMFRTSANRYKNRMAAQVRRQTIGRVQAKAMRGMTNLEQKAYKTTDGVTGLKSTKTDGAPDLQKRGGGAAGAAGGQMPRGGGAAGGQMPRGGGAAGVARAGNAPGTQMVPVGNVSAKQQESAKMGKGKRNRRQQNMAITCMNCGSGLQADWDMCPFCGTPVGQVSSGPAAPQPVVGMPMPQESGEKTVALNLDALNAVQRTVVGWIVAQNGNHRGEDFRIYDGKNILGFPNYNEKLKAAALSSNEKEAVIYGTADTAYRHNNTDKNKQRTRNGKHNSAHLPRSFFMAEVVVK